MKRRLFCLLCGFVACLGWHMAQAGAQELEINLPVEFETLQIICLLYTSIGRAAHHQRQIQPWQGAAGGLSLIHI